MVSSQRLDVFSYASVEDLEGAIAVVYQRQMAFNAAKDTLLEEAAGFPDYTYDRDRFEAAVRYVNSHYGDDGGIASIAKRYAEKELEEPEQARNWSLLLDAVDASAGNGDALRAAHEELWAAFGYTGQAFEQEVQDMPPFEHMLWTWDNDPFTLFKDEGAGMGLHRKSGPTIARYMDGGSGPSTDVGQRKDRRRGEQLDRMLDAETDREPGWMWEEAYYREEWGKTSTWVDTTRLAEESADGSQS